MIFEEHFIFSPSRFPAGEWNPDRIPFPFEDVEIYTDDGVRLHGWLVVQENASRHVLYCHGNAGNLTHRIPIVQQLREQLNATVFIFDYRGFGRSEGTPTQRGLYHDAYAARDAFIKKCDLRPSDLTLIGRSLGAAIALDLGIDQIPEALILECAFTNLTKLASSRYPLLPLNWFLRSRFETLEKIKQYHGPLIINHPVDNMGSPLEHSRRLFLAATRAKPKLLSESDQGYALLLNELKR